MTTRKNSCFHPLNLPIWFRLELMSWLYQDLIQMILVNCISSMRREFYAIISTSTSYFVGLIVMYVGTSELHFCSPHWIQKYLYPKKLSACAKPPYLVLPLCIPSPYSVPPHACPPPTLSHPMHTLPLFYPTPCMPSPYSIPPMHALPLFYPTHACIPPILSQPMHTFPLFYPTPCSIPSPYSIPAHAHPPPIYTLTLFCSTPYWHSPYSIPLYACPLPFSTRLPAHTCHPSILFQLMHALLTPCHMNLEGMFLLWHLRMSLLNLLTLSISSSFT